MAIKLLRLGILLIVIALIGYVIEPLIIPVEDTIIGKIPKVNRRLDNYAIFFDLSINETPLANLSFRSIFVPNPLAPKKKVCAEAVQLRHDLTGGRASLTNFQELAQINPEQSFSTSYELKEACSFSKEIPALLQSFRVWPNEIPNQLATDIQTIRPVPWFPFDQYEIDVSASLDSKVVLSDESEQTQKINPIVTIFIDAENWQISATATETWDQVGNSIPIHQITITRPPQLKLLTVILILIIAFLLPMLYRVEDAGSFLEVAIGILLGLWTINEILIPRNLVRFTIIDAIILLLYVFFGLIVLVRVIRPNWEHFFSKKEPERLVEGQETYSPLTTEHEPLLQPTNSIRFHPFVAKPLFLGVVAGIIMTFLSLLYYVKRKNSIG